MNKTDQIKYAQLILIKGINIQHGQCIRITSTIDSYSFALVIQSEAYLLGAKYVRIEITSDYETLSRANNSNSEFHDYFPDYTFSVNNLMIAEQWAFISITNTDEFNLLNNCNPETIQKLMKTFQISRKKLRAKLMSDSLPWTVAAYPGHKWSKQIYGDENHYSDFLLVFNTILQLDKENPLDEWDRKSKLLKERCSLLNSMKLDKIHFKSNITDLKIYLTPFSEWHGGPALLPDGRSFMPNLPTEEIFTTPDFKKTEGIVKVVKPVEVFGTLIKDLILEFKEGKVIHFEASTGKNMMEKYLTIDSQASFLGEVALVDCSSSINKSNLYFNSILFDENASSHIALGAGYPSCLTNLLDLKNESEIIDSGCNVSSVHTDFMIGTNDMNVTGSNQNGDDFKIMQNGHFVI